MRSISTGFSLYGYNRGNVIDLAVAVIIGVAFGAIVKSLIDDIIMPLIGVIIGGLDFTGLSFTVGSAVVLYGNFIQAVVNFLVIAFVVFLVVRGYNRLQEKEEAEEEVEEKSAPEPSAEEKLLAEIRDLLKERA
jgi:large conductance mechanosensitive channel